MLRITCCVLRNSVRVCYNTLRMRNILSPMAWRGYCIHVVVRNILRTCCARCVHVLRTDRWMHKYHLQCGGAGICIHNTVRNNTCAMLCWYCGVQCLTRCMSHMQYMRYASVTCKQRATHQCRTQRVTALYSGASTLRTTSLQHKIYY